MKDDATDRVIGALANAGKKVKASGQDKFIAQCPAHEDGNPSLSVARGRGQVLLFCFAGCTTEAIADSLHLKMSDLFDEEKGQVYETWNKGNLVRRAYRTPDKGFTQYAYEMGLGTIYTTPGTDLEKAIKAGDTIVVVEGEKDCDTVAVHGGAVAATNSGGAGAWNSFDWSPLKDAKEIVVVADHDAAGYKRVQELGRHLKTITRAIVRGAASKAGKDITDHIMAGHSMAELVPIEIESGPTPEIKPAGAEKFEEHVAGERHYLQVKAEARRREDADAAAKVGEPLATKTLGQILGLETEYDWLVPGLLERRDRLIVTGTEGGGKSFLLKMLCITMAAGVHPFGDSVFFDPAKVLVVDAENTEQQWSRTAKYMTELSEQWGFGRPRENVIVSAGVRLDITQPAGVNEIHRLIDLHKPDVLYVGPLYKMARKEISTDDEAAPLLLALDSFRDRGVTLLMEAHAGHGKASGGDRDLRPRGSSSLMGWPEFGLGLRPIEDDPSMVSLVKWRGDRDERDWPKRLRRGVVGELPWMPVEVW